MNERFNVVVYDTFGFWEYAGRDYTAKAAVNKAKRLVELADHSDEDIERVLITDAGDFTNFLWERGKGVVYPPRQAS